MRKRDSKHDPSDAADPRGGRRPRPFSPRTTYAELLDQVVPAIEQCRREAQRRLEDLARRRVAMTPVQRAAENDALRAEAVAIRNELARLDLVSSLATKLLAPLPAHATARMSPPDPRGNGSPTGLRAANAGLTRGAGDRWPATIK
jgi:hypothetical protein